MAKDMELLDDDMLDAVTGGATLNKPNECNSYSWNGNPGGESCATCLFSGTPFCSYNK